MSLIGIAVELERKLVNRLRRVLGGEAEPHHLEIRQTILDEVEGRIQPIGDGVSVFPYNHLTINLYTHNDDRRYFFESAFIEGGKLKNDMRDRLGQAGCKFSPSLDIEIKFADKPDPAWAEKGFHIEYQRHVPSGQMPPAKLIVVQGQAEQQTYSVTKPNFNIGRLNEIKDKRDRIVRRNDLPFIEDQDEVNQSVSRAHAHIWFDEKEGAFRLCDDNSAQGTRIFRDNRSIDVPRNSPRGVKLHSDDEIYFGRAYVRFEISQPDQSGNLPSPSTARATVDSVADQGALNDNAAVGQEGSAATE